MGALMKNQNAVFHRRWRARSARVIAAGIASAGLALGAEQAFATTKKPADPATPQMCEIFKVLADEHRSKVESFEKTIVAYGILTDTGSGLLPEEWSQREALIRLQLQEAELAGWQPTPIANA